MPRFNLSWLFALIGLMLLYLLFTGDKNLNTKEISYDAMKGQINEIDFQALVNGEPVHSVAEIVILNHDKVQGVLQQHLEEIAYKALPSALVEKIEVDAGNLKVGDSIKVRDLSIASDQDVELLTDLDAVV